MTDINDQDSPGIMMIPSVDAPTVPPAVAPVAPPPAAVVAPAPVPPPAVAPVAPVAPVVVAAPAPVVAAPVSPATPVFDIANIDVAICIDTSGTMGKTIPTSGMTRLATAKESTIALAAEAEKYDSDGITVVKFAGKVRLYDGVTSARVEQIFLEFRPMGSTNTRDAVDTVGKLFLAKRAAAGAAAKPGCIVVITDGEPDDKVGLAQVIVNAEQAAQRPQRAGHPLRPGRRRRRKRLRIWPSSTTT